MQYTLSQAANQLLVKRESLLAFEKLQPELSHCALRTVGERYDESDMLVLRERLVRIYRTGKTLDQHLASIKKKPTRRKGTRTKKPLEEQSSLADGLVNSDAVDPEPVADQDRQQIPQPVPFKLDSPADAIPADTEDEDVEEGQDKGDLWYSDKLRSESLGQLAFAFTDATDSSTEEKATSEPPITPEDDRPALSETAKAENASRSSNAVHKRESPESPAASGTTGSKVLDALAQLEEMADNPENLRKAQQALAAILARPK